MSETQILCSYNGDNKMNPAEGLRIHHPCTRAKETCPGLNFRGLWNLQIQRNVPTQDFPRSYTLNCTQDRNPGCAMIPALDPPSQRWTTQTASPLPQEGDPATAVCKVGVENAWEAGWGVPWLLLDGTGAGKRRRDSMVGG